MKREDVVPGMEYATDLGERVLIAPEERGEDGGETGLASAGWAVDGGEWVASQEFGQRLLADGGHRQYQMNVSLRATHMATGTKITVEPRRLTVPWEQHVQAVEKAAEQRENAQANGAALQERAAKASIKMLTNAAKQEVRLSFEDADTLLRKAKA